MSKTIPLANPFEGLLKTPGAFFIEKIASPGFALIYIFVIAHVAYLVMAQINNRREDDPESGDITKLKVVLFQYLFVLLTYVGLLLGIFIVVFLLSYLYYSMTNEGTQSYYLSLTMRVMSLLFWNNAKHKNVWLALIASIIVSTFVFMLYVYIQQYAFLPVLSLYIPKTNTDEDNTNSFSNNTVQKNQLVKMIMMLILVVFFFTLALSLIPLDEKCLIPAIMLMVIMVLSILSFYDIKLYIGIVIFVIIAVTGFVFPDSKCSI